MPDKFKIMKNHSIFKVGSMVILGLVFFLWVYGESWSSGISGHRSEPAESLFTLLIFVGMVYIPFVIIYSIAYWIKHRSAQPRRDLTNKEK